jgi:hypothetical protein
VISGSKEAVLGKSIIMHVDEAPVVKGKLTPAGKPIRNGRQFIGDLQEGPWINIHGQEPGLVVHSHSHDLDEVLLILEGDLLLGERTCGPGTVIYNEAHTEYGFTVGEKGVRFLRVQGGPNAIRFSGSPEYESRP